MILYKDNPKLKYKTVKTVTGETEYRKNCRKFKDKYYTINVQCFEIEGKWYAYTSKLITFDYELNKYVLLKSNPLVYGVVGFKGKATPVFGYFTENKYNNLWVSVPGYGNVKCFSEKTLLDGGFLENLSDGVWYFKGDLSPTQINKFSRIDGKRVWKEKGYNIEDNKDEFNEKIHTYAKYPLKIGMKTARFAKYLGDITYGCEVETSYGFVPDHIQYRTGVVICRDGSIENGEYVTVPMKGAKGLQNLKYLSEEMCKRTVADVKCSFHIHIGTIPDDRLFLAALYALGIRIQDELYTMFPPYKTDWKGIKKKDYNQKLRKLGVAAMGNRQKDDFKLYIDDFYYRLYKFLNDGNEPDDQFNRDTHNHVRNAKWDRAGRYYWMNFMNMFFSKRKTIEFRLHQATLNHHKMINWLYMCNAILKYAEKNAKTILSGGEPISLNTVLDYYADNFKTTDAKFLSEYLKAYVADRKAYFEKDRKKGDLESKKELADDKAFTFTYKDVTGLV